MTKKFLLRVEPSTFDLLAARAKAEGTSINALVVAALDARLGGVSPPGGDITDITKKPGDITDVTKPPSKKPREKKASPPGGAAPPPPPALQPPPPPGLGEEAFEKLRAHVAKKGYNLDKVKRWPPGSPLPGLLARCTDEQYGVIFRESSAKAKASSIEDLGIDPPEEDF